MCWENPLVRDFNHSLLYKRWSHKKAPIYPLLFNTHFNLLKVLQWKFNSLLNEDFFVLQGRIVSYNSKNYSKLYIQRNSITQNGFHLHSCLNNYNFNHPLLFTYVDFITQIFLFRNIHLKCDGVLILWLNCWSYAFHFLEAKSQPMHFHTYRNVSIPGTFSKRKQAWKWYCRPLET